MTSGTFHCPVCGSQFNNSSIAGGYTVTCPNGHSLSYESSLDSYVSVCNCPICSKRFNVDLALGPDLDESDPTSWAGYYDEERDGDFMTFLSRLSGMQDTYYYRNRMWKNKSGDHAVLVSPSHVVLNIGGAGQHSYEIEAETEIDLDTAGSWDDSQYATAANRAGKSFQVYACVPSSGYTPDIILSTAKTYPAGYTADNSRRIVALHGECADVGTISGHELTGYLAGDILPRSIQDLIHRPYGRFIDGFAWAGPTDFDTINHTPLWASIYHMSGAGANIASVFGAAAKTTYSYYSFAADFNLVGLRMMQDEEFAKLFSGTEEEKNITGSANPTTCGGHVNTSSRRIISHIGLEDMGGVWWTWLRNQRDMIDGADLTAAKAYAYEDLATGIGSDYGQGKQNAVIAGGNSNDGATCGSRARNAHPRRSDANSIIGCRAVAEPQ